MTWINYLKNGSTTLAAALGLALSSCTTPNQEDPVEVSSEAISDSINEDAGSTEYIIPGLETIVQEESTPGNIFAYSEDTETWTINAALEGRGISPYVVAIENHGQALLSMDQETQALQVVGYYLPEEGQVSQMQVVESTREVIRQNLDSITGIPRTDGEKLDLSLAALTDGNNYVIQSEQEFTWKVNEEETESVLTTTESTEYIIPSLSPEPVIKETPKEYIIPFIGTRAPEEPPKTIIEEDIQPRLAPEEEPVIKEIIEATPYETSIEEISEPFADIEITIDEIGEDPLVEVFEDTELAIDTIEEIILPANIDIDVELSPEINDFLTFLPGSG